MIPSKKILKNGLRVITVPVKGTKVITVLVMVKTGSKYEEKKISGISHFLEHMLFKGTKKRPDPLRIAEDMDKIGGVYNAFTGEEYTGYYTKVNSSHIDFAIDWISDIYLNSLLLKEEMEKEKGVIKEEINMYLDNPMTRCQSLFQELLYKDQPAGRDIAGTKESVDSITQEDLSSYKKLQYVAQNTVIAVGGSIKKKDVEEKIEKIFSKMEKGNPKEKAKVKEDQKKPEVLFSYKETDQTHFCLGVRSFNMFHHYRYTQDILAALLGGMMSSRLFIKLRDDLGLAYYVRTDVDSNPDTGVLATQAGVENGRAKEAVDTVVKEYKKIKKEKISPKELKKTKEHLKGKVAIALESSSALAKFYGVSEVLEGRSYTIEDIFSFIDKVTSKEITEVAHKIFQPKNLNLAVVGPHKKKKEFEKVLKI